MITIRPPRRSIRRHHKERMKAKAVRRIFGRFWKAAAEMISRRPLTREQHLQRVEMRADYLAKCSCPTCKFHKDVPPRRERAAIFGV